MKTTKGVFIGIVLTLGLLYAVAVKATNNYNVLDSLYTYLTGTVKDGAGRVLFSNTAPYIQNGFGYGAASAPAGFGGLAATNTWGFAIAVSNVGNLQTGTIWMPPAGVADGWICRGQDVTNALSLLMQQTADAASTVSFTFTSMTTGLTASAVAGDEINFNCVGY